MNSEQFESVLTAYITAMLWSTGDMHPSGEQLDSLEEFELSSVAKTKANAIVFAFTQQNVADCQLFIEQYRLNGHDVYECLGHNLWLTSAGHGVGFWNRDLDELGDRLTLASEAFEVTCYLGDDLLVHLE